MEKVSLREVEESPLFLKTFGIANALYGVSRRDYARILQKNVCKEDMSYRSPKQRLRSHEVNAALVWIKTNEGTAYWAAIYHCQFPQKLRIDKFAGYV